MKFNRTHALLTTLAVSASGLLLAIPAYAQEAAAEEPAKSFARASFSTVSVW